MVAEKVAMSLYKNRGQTDIAECPLLMYSALFSIVMQFYPQLV